MPKALVPLAQGCEELEAVTIIDILRRAGVEVVVAGLQVGPVSASRKTMLLPDMDLESALRQEYDLLALPGGQPGATHLAKDHRILDLARKMASQSRYVAAICAAPGVLAQAGILDGKIATAFPGTLEPLNRQAIKISTQALEVDGRIITSRGPGTAMDFALKLVELLCGKDVKDKVEDGLKR